MLIRLRHVTVRLTSLGSCNSDGSAGHLGLHCWSFLLNPLGMSSIPAGVGASSFFGDAP